MFKSMSENIYGMMAVSSKALKGNVILLYHNQIIFFVNIVIPKSKNLKLALQSTQKIGIGVPAVMKSHPELLFL